MCISSKLSTGQSGAVDKLEMNHRISTGFKEENHIGKFNGFCGIGGKTTVVHSL
jgi:hypothetical protein